MLSDKKYLQKCREKYPQSHDPERQVGAVIVDDKGNVISDGTNAPPEALGLSKPDSLHEIAANPDSKYYLLEHAERNAIMRALLAGNSLRGTTIYVTLYPCADCARAIVETGITRLVVPAAAGHVERDQKWQAHYHFARRIFALAGVKVDFVPMPPEL